MTTNKRRKLDAAPSPQPVAMSAFALRKRLLTGQTTNSPAATANPPQQPDINTAAGLTAQTIEGQSPDTVSPRKSRKVRLTRKPPTLEDSSEAISGHPPHQADHISEKGALSEASPAVPKQSATSLSNDGISINPPPILFSNFNPSKSNYQRRKDGRVHLKLVDGERLVVLGSYGIHVASGEVTINGATLGASRKTYWVDAPYCHALPVIRCPEEATLDLHSHPGASSLRDLGNLSPYFRRLWNDASESPDSTFKILYTSEDGPKRALLQDLVSPAEWNKEIARVVDNLASKPISVMVTGPKSSGKSTFGKLLVNRLITYSSGGAKNRKLPDMAVLDLDPGQPEYGVPGQISLVRVTELVLRPSFCNPLSGAGFEVIRSHSLASISPASDPDLYIEAARDLVTHYRNVLGSCSLIINTPGWIQGTGLDLLTSLIGDLRPTEVIYMSQTGPAEAVESLQEACRTTTFSTLPSQTTQYTSRTAAHLRAMQTMSYFHARVDAEDHLNHLTKWNTNPLTTVPPWVVSYAGENRGIFGIMLYDYQTSSELLADAINGTVLAAVEVESPLAFRHLVDQTGPIKNGDGDDVDDTDTRMDIDDDDHDDHHHHQKPAVTTAPTSSLESLQKQITTLTPEGLPFVGTTHGITTLDPRYSRFVGLVLVRGIDVRTRTLQLLTPIPADKIEEIDARRASGDSSSQIVLVSGKLDPASWAYTEELHYRHSSRRQGGDDGNGNSSTKNADDSDGNDDADDEPREVVEDGTDSEASEMEDAAGSELGADASPTPWIEILHGNQKRGIGSKVWRVRRDLGRMGNPTE